MEEKNLHGVDNEDEPLYSIDDEDGYASSDALEVLTVSEPAKERRIGTWRINERAVFQAIQDAGYSFMYEGTDWYTSDIPIPHNGAFTLPDGRFLWSVGPVLTLLSEKQREQKALDEFDARLAKVREEHASR